VKSGLLSVAIAPKWLGDTIMALPALEAIAKARPGALDILAPPAMERLLRAVGIFREILPTNGGVLAEVRMIRAFETQEAFIFPNSFRTALIPLLARVPIRRGYRTDRRNLLLSAGLPPPDRSRHQLYDYDPLLASVAIARSREVPQITLAPGYTRAGAEALRSAGISPGAPFVGLNPGGIGNPAKRWPADRFARLAVELAQRGIPAVVFAGGADLVDAERIASAPSPRIPVVAADQDVLGLASLLSFCPVLVTNDSGGMHLGASVGARCIALFGPTSPERTGPLGGGHRILKGRTMEEIAVDDVVRESVAMYEASSDRIPAGAAGG
jgi:heptosyltransferase-2